MLTSADAESKDCGDRMTLGERLKLVRGATSQKAFASELRIHENTVSNAERRSSATQEYLLKLVEARNINLHWLLTGQGPMRVGESDASLLEEKISLALADALRAAYGTRYATLSVETRAPCAPARTTCVRSGSQSERCRIPRRWRSSSG